MLPLKTVSPDDVLKVVNGLKNSKSTGTDNIDTWVIKLVASDILPALTHIINLSILQSKFPSMWKQAKVVPLLKKGDPLTIGQLPSSLSLARFWKGLCSTN